MPLAHGLGEAFRPVQIQLSYILNECLGARGQEDPQPFHILVC